MRTLRTQAGGRARRELRGGYTLIEVLIVVVVLGIAGAMVVPTMGNTGIVRVQAGVRQIVSDITFIQSDAVAFQERRAMVVDPTTNSYTLVQVPGTTIDTTTNALFDPTKPNGRYVVNLSDPIFGGATITACDFGAGSRTLIFDALGGPLATAGGNAPGQGGTITVQGAGATFVISVEAFTGRVTVAQN